MARPLFSHQLVTQAPTHYEVSLPITTNATLGPFNVVIGDASGGNITLTLPLARDRRGSEFWIIKKNVGGQVTVSRAGADGIGFAGTASVNLTGQDSVMHLVSDGVSTWVRLQ